MADISLWPINRYNGTASPVVSTHQAHTHIHIHRPAVTRSCREPYRNPLALVPRYSNVGKTFASDVILLPMKVGVSPAGWVLPFRLHCSLLFYAFVSLNARRPLSRVQYVSGCTLLQFSIECSEHIIEEDRHNHHSFKVHVNKDRETGNTVYSRRLRHSVDIGTSKEHTIFCERERERKKKQ